MTMRLPPTGDDGVADADGAAAAGASGRDPTWGVSFADDEAGASAGRSAVTALGAGVASGSDPSAFSPDGAAGAVLSVAAAGALAGGVVSGAD